MSPDDHELPLPTGVQLMALDPAFREDPYPILADLRERDPVHHDTQLNRYVLTRHDDIERVLRNPDHWSDPRKGIEGGFSRVFLGRGGEEPSMLLMDDPGHRRLRNLTRHPFKPRAIEGWRKRAREVAIRVIDEIGDGEFDLVARVANPIPTVVIAELQGVNAEKHEEFKRWSDASVKGAFGPVKDPADEAAAEEASECLSALFREEIEKRRSAPAEDLISSMVNSQESGDRLTDDEIVSQCSLLLLAGNLTTSDLIGNAVMALLRNQDELAKLRARPLELMKNTIEEVLRYDTPVPNSGRIAHEDIEIGGVKIGRGESLSVSLAAANRDPANYPDPNRFDIERKDTHHQSFGGGAHFCLGAHLARLEVAETLSVLLERFQGIRVGDRGHIYASNPSFRGFEEFWVVGESERSAPVGV